MPSPQASGPQKWKTKDEDEYTEIEEEENKIKTH